MADGDEEPSDGPSREQMVDLRRLPPELERTIAYHRRNKILRDNFDELQTLKAQA